MRPLPHPYTGEGTAVLGVLLLTALEMTALATAPRADRPIVAGALVGAATAAFVVVAAVVHSHHRAQREAKRQLTETVDESWFTSGALDGFPMDAIRPLLLTPDAPSLNHLYSAWIFATHGHDAAWLEHNLDLPAGIAHLLADAAERERN
ncbi:hypothetical protein [Streptomyces sp. TP-A0356]|uniref:hypothetical protein n=1 Tax=Streptomyces sp. TP-A0356 TaxID=1359208 RepID=UPI0006E1BEE3|nr:hypothetical protein [Streptomyces sp. TP-A0356]